MEIKNKRGQEGVSSGGVIAGLILLGIVVILLVLGFSGGLDFIFGKIDVIPGSDYDAYIFGCTIAAQAGAEGAYCKDFKTVELPGFGKRVTNCQHPLVEEEVKKEKPSVPDCGVNQGVEFCAALKENEEFEKKVKIYNIPVEGKDGSFKDCVPDDEVVTCESQKGQWKPECSQIDIDLVESGDVTEVHVDGWKCCAA
jgi:hypothetical protein